MAGKGTRNGTSSLYWSFSSHDKPHDIEGQSLVFLTKKKRMNEWILCVVHGLVLLLLIHHASLEEGGLRLVFGSQSQIKS